MHKTRLKKKKKKKTTYSLYSINWKLNLVILVVWHQGIDCEGRVSCGWDSHINGGPVYHTIAYCKETAALLLMTVEPLCI